jgi:hypothetical protein
VRSFHSSIAETFEALLERRSSRHTQRAYRSDVMAFVSSTRLKWPEDAIGLLGLSVKQVQAFRMVGCQIVAFSKSRVIS